MSNELTVSIALKTGPKKINYAAVEFNDGENSQTVVYQSGLTQRHLNEFLVDLLNSPVLKDLNKIAGNYEVVNFQLDKNKHKNLIEHGQLNNYDESTIQQAMRLNEQLSDIKEQTNFNVSFEHNNILNLYNEVLNYEKLTMLSNQDNKGKSYGSLYIVEGDPLDITKFGSSIRSEKENTIENSNESIKNNDISAFIDVIKSEREDSGVYYVGLAVSEKENGVHKPILSTIMPFFVDNPEQALNKQLDLAFFKGELDSQQLPIRKKIAESGGLDVYCSSEFLDTIKRNLEVNIAENDFNLNLSGKRGIDVRNKLQQTVSNFQNPIEYNEAAQHIYVKENSNNGKTIDMYVSVSEEYGIKEDFYGVVIKSPQSKEIIYEIEGKLGNEDLDFALEKSEKEFYAMNNALKYIQGKIKNGHLPNNIEFNIRTTTELTAEMLKDANLGIISQGVSDDIIAKTKISLISADYLDNYLNISKNLVESADRNLSGKKITQSIEYENKKEIASIKNSADFSFNERRKPKKTM